MSHSFTTTLSLLRNCFRAAGCVSRSIPRQHLLSIRTPRVIRLYSTSIPPKMPSAMPSSSNGSCTSAIDVLRTISSVRRHRSHLRTTFKSLALVPTMGALHTGHLALARRAAAENDEVYISIYVNPTQFGVHEDLDAYPRTWDTDLALLRSLNEELEASNTRGRITAVFAPTTSTMYPTLPPSSEIDGQGSFVTITPLGKLLEGASRPVFFRGVATVCMKLFNIVQPDRVYFGQKDVQQTVVIKRMVKDFHVDTQVVIVPTAREEDGLAMSSRNVYLGERRRKAAVLVPRMLQMAEKACLVEGKRGKEEILGYARAYAMKQIALYANMDLEERMNMELEYLSLADPDTMEEVEMIDEEKGAILSTAVRMLPLQKVKAGEDTGENDGGKRMVRLIDNIILEPRRK